MKQRTIRSSYKTILTTIAAVAALSLSPLASAEKVDPTPAPKLVLKAIQLPGGKPANAKLALAAFKGKVTLVDFWASWCSPCIKEFPNFLKAAQEFNDQIVFIALSSDLDEETMTKFLKKLAQTSESPLQQDNVFIALDTDQNITQDLFQVYRLPETILIDSNQRMRSKLIGANWEYVDLIKQIDALLTK